MSANKPVSSEAQSARRRLVRGVFAAPMALTLQHTTASAQSITSVARQVKNGPITDPTAVNGNVTLYVRVQLYTMGGTPVNTASTFVSGADLTALLKPGTTSYLSSTHFQAFSAESASTYTVGQVVTGTPATPGATPALAQNGAFVGVRIDGSGNIVGIIGIPYSGVASSAIFNSTWTSFKV